MSEIDRESFRLKIEPARGKKYKVDLSEFALGGRSETIAKMTSWGGDYVGRPVFARELVTMFRVHKPSAHASRTIRHSLRLLFRFLDGRVRRRGPDALSCVDIKDSDGVVLKQWTGGSNRAAYRHIKSTLNRMRELQGVRPLFWPNRNPDRPVVEAMDEEAVKALFRALREEGRSIKAMFEEGASLVKSGSDPRLADGDDAWKSRENRAWLVHHLLQGGIPDRDRLRREKALRLVTGPASDYLAPGQEERYLRGMVGALRWFVPTRAETTVFYWLFLLGTGWNPSTVCAIDVLHPDGWWEPHPQTDKFAVIHAFKGRSDRHQFAISMKKPAWHPYRILQFIIEKTEPLRRQVLAELAELRRRAATEPGLETQIARLDRLSRTPWLYAGQGRAGAVGGLTGEGNPSAPLDVARRTAERAGLLDRYVRLDVFVAKDAREAWIGHAYVHSRYHSLLTQIAGNHGSLRTTRHYLRSRRYRAYSERQVRRLQDAVFSEIDDGRVVDPTRLRLLVENGKVTAEQEARLNDYRHRTRLGMGCLDPRSPPKAVDPDHPEGALCRVQRCTGCPHGIVFADSMPPLARRYAELMHLKRTMPLASWSDSSFADEAEFDRADARAVRDAGRRGRDYSLGGQIEFRGEDRPWYLSELLKRSPYPPRFRASRPGRTDFPSSSRITATWRSFPGRR